jgi:hypothetical protein
VRKPLGLLVLALLVTEAARAADGKIEVTILGGASVLDVKSNVPMPICLACVVPLPAGLGVLPLDFPAFQIRQTLSLGTGFRLGVRVGYELSRQAEVEAGFAVEASRPQRRDVSFGCPVCALGFPLPLRPLARVDKVASYDYDAVFLMHIVGSKVRPFVFAGIGGISFDTPDRMRTSFAFNFGGGLKLNMGRVGARLEAGDQLVLDHYLTGRAEHDLGVRAGVSLRP